MVRSVSSIAVLAHFGWFAAAAAAVAAADLGLCGCVVATAVYN